MKTREIPAGVRQVVPVTALYNTMKAQETRREADKAASKEEMAKVEALIVQTALAVFKMRYHLSSLPESAALSFRMVEEALADNDVEIIDYTGRAVDDALQQAVDIEGWNSGTRSMEVVGETFTPEIRWQGRLLHTAQVFCQRAAADGKDAGNEAPQTEIVEQTSETEKDVTKETVPVEEASSGAWKSAVDAESVTVEKNIPQMTSNEPAPHTAQSAPDEIISNEGPLTTAREPAITEPAVSPAPQDSPVREASQTPPSASDQSSVSELSTSAAPWYKRLWLWITGRSGA